MKETISDVVRSLTQLYWYLIAGFILILAIVFWQVLSNGGLLQLDEKMDYYYYTFGILITISLIPFAYYFYSQRAKHSKSLENFQAKLDVFRSASTLKMVLFIIAGFVNVIYYYMSAREENMIFALVIIVLFFISKPAQIQFTNEFE